jgi:hypothetical protein
MVRHIPTCKACGKLPNAYHPQECRLNGLIVFSGPLTPSERELVMRGENGQCLGCDSPRYANHADGCRVRFETAVEGETIYPVEPDQKKNYDARSYQVGGDHYSEHEIQVWDIVVEYELSYIEGSALKYLLRRKSDRAEDLAKAKHCIEKLIEIEESK